MATDVHRQASVVGWSCSAFENGPLLIVTPRPRPPVGCSSCGGCSSRGGHGRAISCTPRAGSAGSISTESSTTTAAWPTWRCSTTSGNHLRRVPAPGRGWCTARGVPIRRVRRTMAAATWRASSEPPARRSGCGTCKPEPHTAHQRQGRALPPDTPRGMGLRGALCVVAGAARAALRPFVRYDNHHRPHASLRYQAPWSRLRSAA